MGITEAEEERILDVMRTLGGFPDAPEDERNAREKSLKREVLAIATAARPVHDVSVAPFLCGRRHLGETSLAPAWRALCEAEWEYVARASYPDAWLLAPPLVWGNQSGPDRAVRLLPSLSWTAPPTSNSPADLPDAPELPCAAPQEEHLNLLRRARRPRRIGRTGALSAEPPRPPSGGTSPDPLRRHRRRRSRVGCRLRRGLISASTHDVTEFVGPGSMDVKVEGKAVQLLGDVMTNNKKNAM